MIKQAIRPTITGNFKPSILGSIIASAFTPKELFKNGEQGVWYDPSDLSTLFQDAAGTTPVTSDGDPVGLMLDKSGNGNHATQSVSASRPTYRTDGTLHWLEFDGVDDYMQYPSLIVLSLCAGIIAPAGGAAPLFGQVDSTTNHVFTRDTDYAVSVNGGGGRNTGGISINGGDVFPSDLSGGDISYPAYPTYPVNTKSTLLAFHGVTGDYDSLCRLGNIISGGHSIFSVIISDAYLTDNIQDINDYMNSKMGGLMP